MRQQKRFAVRVIAGLFCTFCIPGGGIGWARAQAGTPAPPAAQDAEHGRETGRRDAPSPGMGRVMGEISAVAGPAFTVKTGDGSTLEVVTTDNTRIMKDRGPVRISDLHVGDGMVAIGNLDQAHRTLHAAMVMAEDAAQLKAMRENLGKTYITGRVTGIDLDDARLTVQRGDHVTQTIGLDETTSFRRATRGGGGGGARGGPGGTGEGSGGRGMGGFGGMGGMAAADGLDRAFNNGESITLADIHVGDFVMGDGTVKNGLFVPRRLLSSTPGQRRGNRGEASPTADANSGKGPAAQ